MSPGSSPPAAPADGCLAALAGFDLMTVQRLRVLLSHHEPVEAHAVAIGRAVPHPSVARLLTPTIRAAWRASADRRDPAEWAARCRMHEIRVISMRDDSYPAVLINDPEPPAALFVRGDLAVLDSRRVGVVGTRNATQAGRDIAFELGRDLAAAGVVVVSGLAKGVDGAAHAGVLRADGAPPAAVVGNGPDEPYPRVHARLWEEVCEHGVLLSEWPPGTVPEPFRFPLRNRILAALSEVLVVIESRERGGSLITAQAAIERSIDVMAVPGSVRNRAAAGTNQLLRDGAAPSRPSTTCSSRSGSTLAGPGRRATTPGRCREAPLPQCWSGAGEIRARWKRSSSSWVCPCRTRR